MTDLLIDLAVDAAGGPVGTAGTLEAIASRDRVTGATVVDAVPISVTLDAAGSNRVSLTAPGADWFWTLRLRRGGVLVSQRRVTFGGSEVTWADLVDVDPDTYVPVESSTASWDATVGVVEGLRGEVETDRVEVESARAAVATYRDEVLAAFLEVESARVAAAAAAANAAISESNAAAAETSTAAAQGLAAGSASAAAVSRTDALAAAAEAAGYLADLLALAGAPGGFPILGSGGTIPASYLPAEILEFRGVWNAAANTPALSDATGENGNVWLVGTSGARDLGSGVIGFEAGDWAVHDGTRFHRTINTNAVARVAGKTGDVVLVPGDVGLGNVQNLAPADMPISTAVAAVLNDMVAGGAIVGRKLILSLLSGGSVDAGTVVPAFTATASALAVGASPTAVVSGSGPDYAVAFGIPAGAAGAKGDPGDLTPSAASTWSGAVTLAPVSPSTIIRTLTGNVTFTGPSNNPGGTVSFTCTVVLKQAASGGPYTVTWPSSLEWAGDAPAPTMPTVANAELIVHLFWTGATWRGMVGGVFYP